MFFFLKYILVNKRSLIIFINKKKDIFNSNMIHITHDDYATLSYPVLSDINQLMFYPFILFLKFSFWACLIDVSTI